MSSVPVGIAQDPSQVVFNTRPVPGGKLLRYRADRRTVAFTVFYFTLVGVQFALDLPWWATAALFPLTCLWCFIGAVNTHNVVHAPIFRKRWMNDVYRMMITVWYGQPVSLFVPVHNHSHHKHAQTRRDVTRSTKVDYKHNMVNLYKATRWGPSALNTCKAFFAEQKRLGRPIWPQFQREMATLLITYVVLAVFDPITFLVAVFLPHQAGQFGIKAINFMQHDGCEYDNDGFNHSRNFVGPIFNFLFLNNGFHTIHHRSPALHWSVLPEAHAATVKPFMDERLDVANAFPYMFENFVYPAERKRFDGSDYAFPPWPEGPDEPWFFATEEMHNDEVGVV